MGAPGDPLKDAVEELGKVEIQHAGGIGHEMVRPTVKNAGEECGCVLCVLLQL